MKPGTWLKRRVAACGIMLMCVLGTGCGPTERSSTPLRLGLNAWPGYEFLYLAQQKGFFDHEGVKVELVELSSLADTRRAYERGVIDGFGTTLIDALQARHAKSPGPRVVWVTDYSNGADVILARNGVDDLKGLKGKKVGVEMVSLGVYILSQALEKSGMNLGDVVPVYLDQTSMAAALGSGELDAIVTYPPTSVELLNQKKARMVFSTTQLPGEVVDVLAFDSKILEDRKDEVRAIVQGFSRAVDYARNHPGDAYAIMARREGISAEDFREAMETGMTVVPLAGQEAYLKSGGTLAEVFRKVDAVMRQAGMISGGERLTDAFTDSCLPVPAAPLASSLK